MTAELRQSLRLAIDRAVRERINWQADPRCAGCGVEQIDSHSGQHRYVAGCGTCSDRASKHRQRTTRPAVQLELELAVP